MRGQVFIFVKEPRPGRVKTRLARGIGAIAAAWWYRHQTKALIRRLDDPRWDLRLAVAPDHEGRQSRVWPAHLARWAQGPGDLGARMGRVMQNAPPGPVVIVGSDIPELTRTDIAAAFKALGQAEAVVGPAPDGGYWLIGLARRRIPHGLFAGVRWSTPDALRDTLATLPGARVARLRELRDVDTVDDLRAFQRGRNAR